MKSCEIFLLLKIRTMATKFSPCKGSYVLNQFPSNVMFGMNGFHVSASGAIQGHHGPLVGDTICVQDRHDHIRSDRSIAIEFAIQLRSDTITTISVHDLLRHSTCRCVLIRASRTDALCCDVLRLLNGCFERFRSRLSHDETATGIATTWGSRWFLPSAAM